MTKFAIVGVGGKQFRVAEGDKITTEKVGEAGKTITLQHVFLTGDAHSVQIGKPLVEGATVQAKVLEIAKADKVRVFKMKQRKRYRREKGHRQWQAKLEIVKIAHTA